jgi:hypothetical protein
MAAVRKASPAHRRHAAVLRRDGALARISVITAAIGVATITAVGMLGVYVAKALPGHHQTATTGATTPSGNSGQATGNSGLNPPSSPTQGASLPAPVTSGSS